MKLTKRLKVIKEKVKADCSYPVEDAVTLLQELSQSIKFKESMDVSVNLGIDPRKSDQMVRGSLVLPQGTGRTVRVAVFTSEANVDAAVQAGADVVGLEDLAEKVKAGEMNFDIVIASPDAMRVVGSLGPVLGPRGLMPNPKDGTVAKDVAAAVKQAKSGQVRYRSDKAGIIHCSIGKVDFTVDAIKENLFALITALKKAKPSSAKGIYLKKVTLSSTMGPGLVLDLATVDA